MCHITPFLSNRSYSAGDSETMSEGSFSSPSGGLDFSGGSGASGGDFQQQIQVQQQSAQLMSQMHHLNDTCWDICITGSFSSALSGREETCITNCVDRYSIVQYSTVLNYQLRG